MRKSLLFFSLAALLIFAATRCWHGSSFCLHKIQARLEFDPTWQTSSDPSVNQLMSQRYFYLGNGAQSYAFVSEDGRVVLKFFKMQKLLPKNWLKALPFLKEYRAKKVEGREKKLADTFQAFVMAYQEFKEESGLLFVHLNPTKELPSPVTLVKEDQEWQVDLNQLPFVLQEKAELIYTRLERLMKENKQAELEQALDSVFAFFKLRDQKGFIDQDSGVSGNFGFVLNRVVQIDVGRLQRKESATPEELAAATRAEAKLHTWKANLPSLIK